MEQSEKLLLALASVFVLGIGAQWLAWRLRLPSILLLLACGFAAGPVSGLLNPDEIFGESLLFSIVSLSVGLILFEGSLSLKLAEIRDVGRALRSLLTVGVITTWVLVASAAYWILDFKIEIAVLTGAILTVTGPTVVGPMLRHIRPTGRVNPIARWEGIVIDPVGAVLAVLVFEAIAHHDISMGVAFTRGVAGLLKTTVAGVGIGSAAAAVLAVCLKRHWIPDRLESPIALMLVVVAFVGSNLLQHESGLIAVTVMGVILANLKSIDIQPILAFKESLSVLLISSLFILLAARVELSAFGVLGWNGPIFVAFVILIARPLSVFISTSGSGLTWQEKLFLSWMAPRGIVAAAVASVFAIRLGFDGAYIVPATFLVIVGTVVVYGLTAFPLARRLGLATASPQGILIASAHPAARAIAHTLLEAGFRVVLVDTNRSHVSVANMEGLEAVFANILSEHATDELDLGGIGRFFAMTSNDEVNSLAAMHFTELFGKAKVYQLAPQHSGSQRTSVAGHHFRGRLLFSDSLTHSSLDSRFEHGASLKTTRLTDEFDFAAFSERYTDAVPLFLITESKKLIVLTAEKTVEPASGQTLVALVGDSSTASDSH